MDAYLGRLFIYKKYFLHSISKTTNSNLTMDLYWFSFVATCGLLYASVLFNILSFSCKQDSHVAMMDMAVNVFAGTCYALILSFPSKKRELRYVDWTFTCPILVYIMLTLSDRLKRVSDEYVASRRKRRIFIYLSILAMLAFGWLGYHKFNICYVLGFVFFSAAFGMLWGEISDPCETKEKSNRDRRDEEDRKQLEILKGVYYAMVFVWSMYGVAYLLGEKMRNVSYNILDLISKSGFAFVLFKYLSHC